MLCSCFIDRRIVDQNRTLDSLCPTWPAKIGPIMNLPNAIDRRRDLMRRQHKAIATEASYVYWLRHYVTALNTMPSSLPSEQKVENFLTGLARHRDLSASTQNQAFNAILFFPLKTQATARAPRFQKSA
jgi:hypothetical protein